jgi:polar amino acid transport system substrate-binding protein
MGQKELKVGFPKSIPPYTFENGTGIEIELFKAIIEPYGYKVKPILMSFKRGKISVQKGRIDAMSTMKVDKDASCHYSDEYIRYHNFAITLKSSNITLNSIKELKGKSIITWQDAHTMLGKDYFVIFNNKIKAPYIKKYREMVDQGQQSRLFWANRVDVVIMDKGIFDYYKKLYAKELDTTQDVTYHDIIGDYTAYHIAFKDNRLRDKYNLGLKRIKSDGTYEKIFRKYN